MIKLKIIILLLIFGIYSCGQTTHPTNRTAVELNDKIIPLVNYLSNSDSCIKALTFLDSATIIDSNCFLCYYNKLMFLKSLKQYDKAISTVNRLLRLKPFANDLYLSGGVYYMKIGDTASAKVYFQKSLDICNGVLDTISVENRNYVSLTINKALDIILLGDQRKGNEILKDLRNKQTDSTYSDYISSFMNKSSDELLEFSEGKYGR